MEGTLEQLTKQANPQVRHQQVPIAKISPEWINARALVDDATVEEYREALRRGEDLPDVEIVEENDGTLYLIDGWHRKAALETEGETEISARVYSGTLKDAKLAAAASNAQHGKPRTDADKRRAVEIVVELEPDWSVRQIANFARVSIGLVQRIRAEKDPLEDVVSEAGVHREHLATSERKTRESGKPKTVVGRDGKSYPKRKPKAEPRQGQEKLSAKERKEIRELFGKFVRLCSKRKLADGSKTFSELIGKHLDAIAEICAEHWGGRR